MGDALRRMGRTWSLTPWWPALPLLAVQLASGLWYMPQTSFFPIYLEEQLGFTPVVIASFLAAGQVAGMIAGLVGGVLGDAIGSKSVLALGLFGAALASMVFLVSAPWLVASLWIVGGLSVGFHALGGSSYLTRVADPRSLGVLSAFYELCLTMGGALGNPVAGMILDAGGFRIFGYTILFMAAVTLVGVLLFMPARAADRSDAGAPVQRVAAGALSLVRRPEGIMLIALRYLPTVCYGMMGMLVPLAINRLTGSKTTVALYGTVTLVVASGAQLLAGRAADRFGWRWPVVLAFGSLIVSALGLAAFSSRVGVEGIFVFGVSGNAAAWSLSALLFCMVAAGVPKAEHGRMFGLLHTSWSIGMISGVLLGGALVRFSPGLPFFVAGLIQLLSITLVFGFFARVSRHPQNAI